MRGCNVAVISRTMLQRRLLTKNLDSIDADLHN
jgi:hypothetical protein